MIKQLEIENFRCFGQSTLSGFERVNLIGGQNNSGKTAFLEALYLNCSPRAETVMKLRGITEEIMMTFPERAWDGLFLNHNNQANAKVTSDVDIQQEKPSLLLSCNFLSAKSKYPEGRLLDLVKSNELDNDEFNAFNNIFTNSENLLSILNISFSTEKYENMSLILATKGRYKIIERNGNFQQISFISATEKAPAHYLAQQYDKSYFKGYADKINEAFNIVDPSIREVRTLMSGDTLYLSRKNQRPMSIALFGDAMNRVAHFALELINNQAGILLVDEIENGIHHSHQKQLWQWLFALAVELDVQIFATTHSLEMLTAFKEAAMGTQYESEAAYFEFARHVKTGEIIGIKHQIDELDYALSHDGEIRGE